ncbi:DUF5666 domain-containing protein [Rhodothermus profundi]|uniref:Por secretion system C-terminal sorting domain-containing protein n=1 Tax=Rhodothermus profundi TaxID=633813 RepID=A0A1M6QLU7_9BACT|nr:DUF5666 domain-containing protein [Rhodothermus profundi]SHK21145.1 Por secretion system C-terminal sorting domain-containing protein [Rhodothermus profundi]
MRRIVTTGFLAFLLGLMVPIARADDHPGFELEGTIEALDQATLTLHGITFNLTATTRIRNAAGHPIPASQLQVGQRIELAGHFGADGLYYALKIKLEEPDDSTDEVEAWGPLTALTDSTLTVQGLTFYLSATTQVSGRLVVGQRLEVEGIVQGGRFVALEISSGRAGEIEERHPKIELEGPITAISDSTLEVQGHTVRVLSTTRIVGDNDQPLTLADLQVGVFVEIKARLLNGQLVALVIEVEKPDRAEMDRRKVEIEGIILERTDSTFTVGTLTFHLTPVTKIEGEDDQPLTPAALQVGVFVEVKGYLDPTTHTLYALKVQVEQPDARELELVGHIEALGSDSLVVAGITIFVDANTRIEDPWEQPLTLADLKVGLLVKVEARQRDDGTYLALEIKIRKVFHPVVEIEGPIEALTDSTITVAGQVFRVRPGVHVLGPNGQVVSLTDLQVGQKVKVRGVVHPDGTYWAVRIRAKADQPDDAIELEGTIESLGPDSLVVAGVTVFVNANTQILAYDGTAITLADLQTGLIVEIKALQQPGVGLVAQQIKVEDFVEATGQADSVRADAVILQQVTFLINAQTVVVNAQQQPINWSDIQPGQQVVVQGRRVASAGKAGTYLAGTTYVADYVTVLGNASTTNTEAPALPVAFELAPSYPNPFRQQTTIRFTLNGTGPQPVTLEIYNVLGQRVRMLIQMMLPPGLHEVTWDATDETGRPVASGLYLYRLRVGNQVQTRSMVLMR